MRLIDADKLCEDRVSNDPVRIAAMCEPTVDAVPVKRGKWFGNTCSACGLDWDENMVDNADDWGYFSPMPNFCLNCGADMREVSE